MEQETGAAHALWTDEGFVSALRQQMLRFAQLQLSDLALAEDAVQEALVGALKNVQSFGGRAAFKTWVFAILRHKIADTLRQKSRHPQVSSVWGSAQDEEDFGELFNDKGYWQADERPAAWGNPQDSLRQTQFWRVFELCLNGLPDTQARVFMMKEFIELDAQEVCDAVGISSSNLHVLLYRARMRLRLCLQGTWFDEGAGA